MVVLDLETHLLNAIGLKLQDENNVMFISAERFMYHFIKSIKKNDMVNFMISLENHQYSLLMIFSSLAEKTVFKRNFFILSTV